MDPLVFALVLAAAAAHASWNAVVEVGGDPGARLALLNAIGGLCAAALLPFVGFPAPASWPFLFGSVVFHFAYFVFLTRGYQTGDLSQVYLSPAASRRCWSRSARICWLASG